MKKEALNWLGELAIIHATGNDTNGKYCIVELYATKEGSPRGMFTIGRMKVFM